MRRRSFSLLFIRLSWGTIAPMLRLTRQERTVLCVVLFLLLTGWLVKTWRTMQPPATTVEMPEPNLNAHRSF
jgi:hypothetical protein